MRKKKGGDVDSLIIKLLEHPMKSVSTYNGFFTEFSSTDRRKTPCLAGWRRRSRYCSPHSSFHLFYVYLLY